MDRQATVTRDLVLIGCSAGGVEALPRLLHELPEDLPAAVCIVQHLSASHVTELAEILDRRTELAVHWAEQGEPLTPGNVYVAPPDHHLLLADHHLRLSRSARENHVRPSIDKLFRSAAAHHGGGVIAMLLTGTMHDGVAGLRAIRDAGGVVFVQDPADAAFDELPRRALEVMTPDRTLRLDEMPHAVLALAGQSVRPTAVPDAVAAEARIDEVEAVSPHLMEDYGAPTTISCPDCHGPMWQVGDERVRRFRCYLGHVADARALLSQGSDHIESALWSAVRALHDRATTLETLATDALQLRQEQSAEAYASRAREAREQADLARQFLLDLLRPHRQAL